MKRLMLTGLVALATGSLFAAASADGEPQIGVWHGSAIKVKAKADEEHIPVVIVLHQFSCSNCAKFESAVMQSAQFKNWMANRPYLFADGYSSRGTWTSTEQLAFASWVGLGPMPCVCGYWLKKDGTLVGGKSTMFQGSGYTVQYYLDYFDNLFKGYTPEGSYDGATFAVTADSPGNRLEAESGTTSIRVPLTREGMAAATQKMEISAPGKTTQKVDVVWAKDQTEQTVTIGSFNTDWFQAGKDVTLRFRNKNDEVASELAIPCLTTENSASNPDFTGCSDYGVWTMDLEAAKAKVAAEKAGQAYTLLSVQGSLWCPDCANVERNFLDLKDKGVNRFAKWAKEKRIALVSVDIPVFSGSAPGEYSYPTLLSTKAAATTLVRNREGEPGKFDDYPAISGGDPALTQPVVRSGLGYLTRKNVSDEEAAARLRENQQLVQTDVSRKTDAGHYGVHLGEDGSAFRTGVPIFVLLKKDGTVAARMTRWASVSPMQNDASGKNIADAAFDNYIKRFEEMISIATGEHKDATEPANNAPAGAVSFQANGGETSGEISHTDFTDTFRLAGVGGNALQKVTVKGESAAVVTVSFVSTNAQGQISDPIASASGPLNAGKGVELEYTFANTGDFFVQVRGADITSDAFRDNSPIADHFHAFSISGTVVLVPQENEAEGQAAQGTKKATIRLNKGAKYHITGDFASCAALQQVEGKPEFYTATAEGDAEVVFTQTNGKIKYQLWNPGTVGFTRLERTVTESVCDLDGIPLSIGLSRYAHKSGEIKVKVSVDTNLTTLATNRYALTEREQTWADGDLDEKFVKLMIEDDIFYDGTFRVVLKAEVVSSTAGDATLAEGREVYTLTITEDDIQAPGRVYFKRADPGYARSTMLYARENEGATLYATRDSGSDGLVMALLYASDTNVTFETGNERDIEKLSDLYPEYAAYFRNAVFLYWSSREAGEKGVKVNGLEAGKTVRVWMTPVNASGVSASNAVTVVAVPGSALEFEAGEVPLRAYRNVSQSFVIPIRGTPTGSVVFNKLSGTLPAGLSARVGPDNELLIDGVLTAEAGQYEAVYRVEENIGTAEVPEIVRGLTTRITFTVLDVTAPEKRSDGTVLPPVNPALAVSRAFKNVPVIAEAETRMVGTVQIAVPATGRVSARYSAGSKRVTFASRSWAVCSEGEHSEVPFGTLTAKLEANEAGYGMTVSAFSNGMVKAVIVDPAFEKPLVAESDGRVWSSKDSAEDWAGYYTVAIKHRKVEFAAEKATAPTGDGYLALKMNTHSAVNSGTFKVAGMLPNGSKVSGSFVLERGDGETALLPILETQTEDTFSAIVGIVRQAVSKHNRRCVESPEWCDGFWEHAGEDADDAYAVRFTLHGGYYDAAESLSHCCETYYSNTNLILSADGKKLAKVNVSSNSIEIVSSDNPAGATLKFVRSTGVVSGRFTIPDTGVRTPYAGIVVNGWGDCHCDPTIDVVLPLVSGSHYLGEAGFGPVSGGAVKIDSTVE